MSVAGCSHAIAVNVLATSGMQAVPVSWLDSWWGVGQGMNLPRVQRMQLSWSDGMRT